MLMIRTILLLFFVVIIISIVIIILIVVIVITIYFYSSNLIFYNPLHLHICWFATPKLLRNNFSNYTSVKSYPVSFSA